MNQRKLREIIDPNHLNLLDNFTIKFNCLSCSIFKLIIFNFLFVKSKIIEFAKVQKNDNKVPVVSDMPNSNL